MIQFEELKNGTIVEMAMVGRVSREDFRHLIPQFERLVDIHGKLRVLVLMRDFEGWSPGGLLEDTKFSLRHASDVDRIAFVGDKKWEQALAAACKPFTSAEIRFFEPAGEKEAREWIGAQTGAEAA